MRFFFSKRTFLSLMAAFLSTTLMAGWPKYETRAVWLTTIGGLDWPSSYSAPRQQAELCSILDKLQEININTVLIQTRIRASVIYPSDIEPWDGCMAGDIDKSPGYDPLQFAIDECHRRGMEIHAWVVTIPVGKWNSRSTRLLRSRYPSAIKQIDGEGYMDPSSPYTARYLADICREITKNYDIDGIHLDYIRYPETWKESINPTDARKNITHIVCSIHNAVKTEKPWVKLSCSPVGKFDDLTRYNSLGWNAYSTVYQDAQGWLNDGLMDMLFPMMYFRNDQFFPFVLDWKEHSPEGSIAAGLGIYFLDPMESPKGKEWSLDDVRRQLYFIRQNGVGQCFFRTHYLINNTKGIYDLLHDEINLYPALVPELCIEQQQTVGINKPFKLTIDRHSKHDLLVWTNVTTRYNVYASPTFPVDTSNPENLIAVKYTKNGIAVPHPTWQHLFYVVIPIDRFGNETR